MTAASTPVRPRRFPELTVSTPRLVLRPVTGEDAGDVTEVFADQQVARWLPVPRPYLGEHGTAWCGELAAQRREHGDGDHYGIVRRIDERLIGCAWTRRTDWTAGSTEIVVAMAGHARGYGLAQEAVDALKISLMFEHGLQRIELRVAPGNLALRRVAEQAGFRYEGLLRNAGCVRAERVDLEMWSLISADLRGVTT